MKLKKFNVKNYRSISDCEILFSERCRILIGINESGKSNILKSLTSINEDFVFAYDEDAKNSSSTGTYEKYDPTFRYFFSFEKDVIEKILKEVFGQNIKTWPFEMNEEKLEKFIAKISKQEYSHEITYNSENKRTTVSYYARIIRFVDVKDNYHRTIENLNFFYKNGNDYHIPENIYFYTEKENLSSEWIGEFEAKTVEVNPTYLEDILSTAFCNHLRANLPTSILWEYKPSTILNSNVSIDSFISDPDICLPLKNIFFLAGIKAISTTVSKARENVANFHNLLDKLGSAATEHIHSTWKDYKDISVLIKSSNNNFSIFIKDKNNIYDFKSRSDGFRRFISFILLLSAKNKTEDSFSGHIILFDEPEIGLHPSGTRHLLEEMIEISRKNYCVLATHSIFMIDRSKIDRHIVVTKENEDTMIVTANMQNFSEEEVLYNALGFSAFEIVKEVNLFFEGWTDKELFKICFDYFSSKLDAGFELDEIGICWSGKASKITSTIAPLITLPNRYFLVVSDHDKPALDEQKNFRHSFGKTKSEFLTYKEVSQTRKKIDYLELEDFLPSVLVEIEFNKILLKVIPGNTLRFEIKDFKGLGILKSWEAFVARNYKEKRDELKIDDKEIFVSMIKDALAHKNLEENSVLFSEYLKVLKGITKKIQKQIGSR